MSKYLEHIQNGIKEAGDTNVTLFGSTIMIEIVERENKTSSGIILAPIQAGKELREGIVVATGPGFYDDETGETPGLDTKVGDVVYVDPMHVRLLYNFPVKGYQPNTMGLIDEAQISIRFRGKGAVEAFRRGAGISG